MDPYKEEYVDFSCFDKRTSENTLPNPAAYNSYTSKSNNMCNYNQGVFVPADNTHQMVTTCDTGEMLCYNPAKRLLVAVRNKNNKCYAREVCYGTIVSARIIRYKDRKQIKSLYTIQTLDFYGVEHSFIIKEEDFDSKNFIKLLSEFGRLIFFHYKRDETEAELIQKFIRAIAVIEDNIYPEYPCWVDGKYWFALQSYDIDTPFFNNVLIGADYDINEHNAVQAMIRIFKMFLQPFHFLFFMIIWHYVILQTLISSEFTIGVYVEKAIYDVVLNALSVFNRDNIKSISITEKYETIERYIKDRKGGVAFIKYTDVIGGYSQKKAQLNMEKLINSHYDNTVVVIICSMETAQHDDFFKMSLRECEVNIDISVDCNSLGKYAVYFTDWIFRRKYSDKGVIDKIIRLRTEDIKEEGGFLEIYSFIKEYISELGLSMLLPDNAEEEIKKIFNLQQENFEGLWAVELFGELYKRMCISGECQQIIFGKGIIDFKFRNDMPTVIEKDGLIFIRECDLKHFLKSFPEQMTADMLKKALKEADVLLTDKNSKYRKNLYIPCMKKPVRMLAIYKDRRNFDIGRGDFL